ncbi:hypothetical protein KC318_g56 [Hortaea werneckii]|nr:hypothetical protein KC334_g53 [Hortaea werneckii]KAI7028392.1 hypothetical protein KC355_g55 [Hortaea werneckii]KAI7676825.1 hypothetical protein KC318_g56 [Hortaea werneckii]
MVLSSLPSWTLSDAHTHRGQSRSLGSNLFSKRLIGLSVALNGSLASNGTCPHKGQSNTSSKQHADRVTVEDDGDSSNSDGLPFISRQPIGLRYVRFLFFPDPDPGNVSNFLLLADH